MSKSKKAEPTPQPGRGPVYNLRLSHELAAALTNWVNDQKVAPDKSAVMIEALKKFLAEDGYWPPKAEGE